MSKENEVEMLVYLFWKELLVEIDLLKKEMNLCFVVNCEEYEVL